MFCYVLLAVVGTQTADHMASSAWGSLANPLTLEGATDGCEALLAFVDVTKAGYVSRKLLSQVQALRQVVRGLLSERIAAHLVLPAK